jgi:hypothetical protein
MATGGQRQKLRVGQLELAVPRSGEKGSPL